MEGIIIIISLLLVIFIILVSIEKINNINTKEFIEKKELLVKLIKKHFNTLFLKYENLSYIDSYGYEILQENSFEKEIKYLINIALKKSEIKYLENIYDFVKEEFLKELKEFRLSEVNEERDDKSEFERFKNIVTGQDYEEYIKFLLEKLGYKVRLTPSTADNGVDLIAEKDDELIAIQCKFYNAQKVSNSAIQEVYSGMKLYRCNKAYVITNSEFTKNARGVATRLGVFLLNDKALKQKTNSLSL